MSGTLGAFGNLDYGASPNLGNLITPIQNTSISFEAIKQNLMDWVKNKPDGYAWSDWFDTNDGTIIAEWIAGLAVFSKVSDTMLMRENSLDFAQLDSSVFELAFDRGLLVSPAAAPVLTLSLTTPLGSQVLISPGDLIGTQGNYELYSLEGKTLGLVDTLDVAVGHMNVYTPGFSTLGQFATFEVPTQDKYIAAQLETFSADGQSITLLSEPDNVGGFNNGFLLRRVLPGQVRIYVGNGVMGWWSPSVRSITYSCLSYGNDILASGNYTPTISINAQLTAFVQTQAPSFDPDAETIRAIARYYPMDGKIVRDEHYSAVIRKYFGGVLYDAVALNTDPDEVVYLLPNPNFGFGTPQGTSLLNQISALVDSKRMLNIQVLYNVLDPAAGQVLSMVLTVPKKAYSYELQTQINQLTAAQVNQFARSITTLSASGIANQLSARFGVTFTPTDPTVSLTLKPTDFLQSFSVGLSPV